jgi:hypothetical protein
MANIFYVFCSYIPYGLFSMMHNFFYLIAFFSICYIILISLYSENLNGYLFLGFLLLFSQLFWGDFSSFLCEESSRHCEDGCSLCSLLYGEVSTVYKPFWESEKHDRFDPNEFNLDLRSLGANPLLVTGHAEHEWSRLYRYYKRFVPFYIWYFKWIIAFSNWTEYAWAKSWWITEYRRGGPYWNGNTLRDYTRRHYGKTGFEKFWQHFHVFKVLETTYEPFKSHPTCYINWCYWCEWSRFRAVHAWGWTYKGGRSWFYRWALRQNRWYLRELF